MGEKRSGILRLVAGAYLVYLAYSLFKGVRAGDTGNPVVMMGAAIIFAVLGAVIVYFGIRGLRQQADVTDQAESAAKEDVQKEQWLEQFEYDDADDSEGTK